MLKVFMAFLVGIIVAYFALSQGKPALDTFTTIEIPTLLKRAKDYDGRTVTVVGTVGYSAAIMGAGAYRVIQGDAEVLVLSAHGIPQTGTEVRVRGTFKQAVVFNGLQYSVILEK